MREEKEQRHSASCPDCEIRASNIWVSHEYSWVPIGFLCKKCGYIEIWGLADSLTKSEVNEK